MQTIMIVDDSIIVRKVFRAMLQRTGYEVIEAVDGIDALRNYAGGKIDLLITDINMPNLDGLSLIRELRARNESFPILVISSESDKRLIKEGYAAGAAGWIVKPVVFNDLVNKVRQLLE